MGCVEPGMGACFGFYNFLHTGCHYSSHHVGSVIFMDISDHEAYDSLLIVVIVFEWTDPVEVNGFVSQQFSSISDITVSDSDHLRVRV